MRNWNIGRGQFLGPDAVVFSWVNVAWRLGVNGAARFVVCSNVRASSYGDVRYTLAPTSDTGRTALFQSIHIVSSTIS